jgi:hypothetical protein
MQLPIGASLTPIHQQPLAGCEPAQLQTFVKQRRITSWPYYSKVKFIGTRAVSGGGFTYTMAQGVVLRAFSYSTQETKIGAGFTAADGLANISDTNLTTRNQTTGGQNVLIHGIALNGDENRYRLGTIGMLPGAGGLMGGSEDASGDNSVAGKAKSLQFPTNGWPVKSNFFRVPEGLVWRNQSNSDSNLNVVFTTQRPIQVFSGGSPQNIVGDIAVDNAPANVATAEGYAYPTELAVELMVFMVGEVIGPRSRVT